MKEITYEKTKEKISKEIDKLYNTRSDIWKREVDLKRELDELTKKEKYLDITINALEKSKGIILDIIFNE